MKPPSMFSGWRYRLIDMQDDLSRSSHYCDLNLIMNLTLGHVESHLESLGQSFNLNLELKHDWPAQIKLGDALIYHLKLIIRLSGQDDSTHNILSGETLKSKYPGPWSLFFPCVISAPIRAKDMTPGVWGRGVGLQLLKCSYTVVDWP